MISWYLFSKEIFQNIKSHEILNMCRKPFHRQKVKFVVKFRILNLHILLIIYFEGWCNEIRNI